MDECENKYARFWEDFYIDLFKSYGFDLKQTCSSAYPSDRMDTYIEMANINVRINKDLSNALDIICQNSIFTKQQVIRDAIKDKVRKIIYSNNDCFKYAHSALFKMFNIENECI